ncbi:hypothetical protein [Clostridium botulinum]
MNRNKKNKNVKVNKAIENSGNSNSNSIDALNSASSNIQKNTKHKNK